MLKNYISQKPIRNVLVKIFLVLFGIFISVAVIELVLRIYYFAGENFLFGLSPARTTLKFYDNDIFGSALVPNQKGWFVASRKEYANRVEVNSQGWPDVEHTYQKSDNIYRILIIGDSFVENFQVPFEKRFFRQLQERLGPKYEVIAMGRGNTGTGPQYLILKNYGLKYKPDLVIQMFYEANDVKNNSPSIQKDPFLPYFSINESGNLIQLPFSKRSLRKLAGIKEFLTTNSSLIQFILEIRHKIIQNEEERKFGYPIDYRVYDKNYMDEYVKSWEVTKKLILETKRLSENNGAKYMFVGIPGSEQVEERVQKEIQKNYPLFSFDETDFNKPDKVLSGFCKKEKIDCSFLSAFFGEYINIHPSAELYYFYDGHWNETGTNLATDFLYQKILQH